MMFQSPIGVRMSSSVTLQLEHECPAILNCSVLLLFLLHETALRSGNSAQKVTNNHGAHTSTWLSVN